MNRLTDGLYRFTAVAILSTIAVMLAFRCGNYEGRKAAYETQLQQCERTYPKYRCEIELARYFEVQR